MVKYYKIFAESKIFFQIYSKPSFIREYLKGVEEFSLNLNSNKTKESEDNYFQSEFTIDFKKYKSEPNLEIKALANSLIPNEFIMEFNVYPYAYNEQYQEEKIVSVKTKLKYDLIIEPDIKFEDIVYKKVIDEINGAYKHHYFTSMYILIRKLLENLIYDCLKSYYKKENINKFYDEKRNQHHGFGKLLKNFNLMIKEHRFKIIANTFDQKFIDLLNEFKKKGNIEAHSLFNLPHQKLIEENKDQINILINVLNSIIKKVKLDNF